MENSNSEKTNLPILKTKDLPDSFVFHDCVIGKSQLNPIMAQVIYYFIKTMEQM